MKESSSPIDVEENDWVNKTVELFKNKLMEEKLIYNGEVYMCIGAFVDYHSLNYTKKDCDKIEPQAIKLCK